VDIYAKWIWLSQDDCLRYNETVVVKRQFVASDDIINAKVSITADTFYRLYINDQWINDGPARGWPEHYYYDQVDVAKYLQQGTNEIKVICCYYGAGHFHGIPQQAGLLTQIDIEYANGNSDQIITDSSWQIAVAHSWKYNTPKISCQMGPAEYYEASCENNLVFKEAAELYTAHEGPWKDLRPRDVKLLTKEKVNFNDLIQTNVLSRKENETSFCIPWTKILYPSLVQANRRIIPAFCVASILELSKDTKLKIDVMDFRGGSFKVFVNADKYGNESIHLAPGKHLILISHGMNLNHMTDITISVDADQQYKLTNPYNSESENPWGLVEFADCKFNDDDMAWSKDPHEMLDCIEHYRKHIARLSQIDNIDKFISQTCDMIINLSAGEILAKDNYLRFLSRQVIGGADVKLDNPQAILRAGDSETIVYPDNHGDVELVYDLGVQNIGYYSFEIKAQGGVEIDIFGVEYIDKQGKVQYPDDHRNGMTYITKAGVNKFTSLKRRSGRYIFVRFNKQTEPITVTSFNLIESTYPVEYKGSFQCSDQNLNKIWDISAHTLKLCMEDVFTDCPLYEQTLWVGDARNESLFAYGIFGATDIAKRCITLAGQSLERFPLVGCQLPSSWHCILPAWSFLWGISVWEYFWYTKDQGFVREIWPDVVRNLKGAQAYINSVGLFSADFWNLFDWAGIDQDHETVLHTSMFMVGAVDAAIKCGKVIDTDVVWLKELRASLENSINKFWKADKGSYPDSIHTNGEISDSTSQHTSFLSLLYDIADGEHKDVLLGNMIDPPAEMVKVGSPFAMFFMYEALEKLNRQDMILKSIYDNYMPMVKAGATTVWESFASGTLAHGGFPTRSHCHAWSSAPVYFLNRIILGITQTSAGCESFEVSPHVTWLDWAKGTFATPHGPVEVSWQKNKKDLFVEIYKPNCIQITFKPNDTHKSLNVKYEINRK